MSGTRAVPVNQRAWLLAAPVAVMLLVCLAFPIILLAVRSLFGSAGEFIGERAFGEVFQSQAFWLSALRSLGLAFGALAIEAPLGLALGLAAPRRGWGAGVALCAMAAPLMIPPAVVGHIWNAFAAAPGAPLASGAAASDPIVAWIVLFAMDAWRWTGLVALLIYVALADVPERMMTAAEIDGASGWSVFRHVQLPCLWRALVIAALLRFADSFTAFAEALTFNGGGPQEATTLLGVELLRLGAAGDLARAAAAGLIQVVAMLAFARLAFAVLGKGMAR